MSWIRSTLGKTKGDGLGVVRGAEGVVRVAGLGFGGGWVQCFGGTNGSV